MTDIDLHEIELRALRQDESERSRIKKPKNNNIDSDGADFPELNAIDMMKLRMANVSEEKVADYFGITVEALREALEKDEDLKIIFDAGPGRGKAKIQITQYTTALLGDSTMLKHFGEHNLGQKSTIKHEGAITLEEADRVIAALKAALGQDDVQKALAAPDVVDGEFEEIEDETKDR